MKSKTYSCPLCKGKVTEKKIKLDLWVEGKLIVIEDVPADVCNLCGEEAVSPDISKKIDRLILGQPKSQTVVPVFSLRDSLAI